jgi:hypothetical protein
MGGIVLLKELRGPDRGSGCDGPIHRHLPSWGSGEPGRDRRLEIGSGGGGDAREERDAPTTRVVVSSKSRDEGPDLDLILDLTKDPQRLPKQYNHSNTGPTMIRLRLLKILATSSTRSLSICQPLRLGFAPPPSYSLDLSYPCPPLVQRKEVSHVLTMQPPERASPKAAR